MREQEPLQDMDDDTVMDPTAEEEHDVYVSQLREVFSSCDHVGDGFLERAQLEALCAKLQLQEHTDTLLHQLLGNDPNARVWQ